MESNEILEMIKQADDLGLNDIFFAAMERWGVIFPDWETVLISLPKHDMGERKRILAKVTEKVLKEKW